MLPESPHKKKTASREWSSRQTLRILRRLGLQDEAIRALTPEQQAELVHEAMEYGISVSSLPPSATGRSDRLIYLEKETGRRVAFEEFARNPGDFLARTETTVICLSLEETISAHLKDNTLDDVDRALLERLKTDFRVGQHWQVIKETPAVVTQSVTAGDLIWQILTGRQIAAFVAEYPEREEQARNAEQLANFLARSDQFPGSDYQILADLAARLRQPEDFRGLRIQSIPVSRKGRNTIGGQTTKNTREVVAFINWMTRFMKESFGKPFNAVVATITDVTYPERETTIDQVRAALKLETRRHRSRK